MATTDFTTTISPKSFQLCLDPRHPQKRQFRAQACSCVAAKRPRKNPQLSSVGLNFWFLSAVFDSRFGAQVFLRIIFTMLRVERPLQPRIPVSGTECCYPREDAGSGIGENLNSGPVWLGSQSVSGGDGGDCAGGGAGSVAVPPDFSEARRPGLAPQSSETNPSDDDTLHVMTDDTPTDDSHEESTLLGTPVAEECSHPNTPTPETLPPPESTCAGTENQGAEEENSKTVPALKAPDSLSQEVRSLCVTSTDIQEEPLTLDSPEKPFTEDGTGDQKRDRRRQLQQRVVELRRENQRLRARQTCVHCRTRPISLTLLPCGHLCLCAECGPSLDHCPLCHKAILADVRTFL